MAHATLCARHRRPLLAVLLGALACGDGNTMSTASVSGANRAPEAPSAPAAANPAANPGMDAPPPAATEAPSAPSTAQPTNGSGEGVAPNPIQLGEAPAPNAGSGENNAPDAPSTDAPANADPGSNGPGSNPSLVRGADPTRESATAPGPLQVTTLTTGLRDGPDYGTQTLYVPEGVEPPFASVAIVPGFNVPEASIQAWGPFLASHGIVALTIGTNNLTDSAEVRARALLDALATLEAEDTRAGGPLEGKLATDHLGIMGWSLGGGGTLIAASRTPSLKAAITLAAYGPGAQFPEDRVPTLFLAGSADRNAGGQSQGMFASLPETTPKMLFEVQDGPHEIGNDPRNADGAIGRYGLSWLEVFLVGDERYRQFLEETPTQASDFRQNLGSAP